MTKAMQKRTLRRGHAVAGMCVVYLALMNGFPLQAQLAYAGPAKQHHYFQGKENKITLQVKNEKLQSILEKIEKQSRFVFVYSNDEINTDQKISFNVKDKDLAEALAELLSPLRINYDLVNDKIILKPAAKSNSPLA